MLIRLGATPITSSRNILEVLGFPLDVEAAPKQLELSTDEQKLYDLLSEPLTRDVLIRKCEMPTSSASVIISLMELKGSVVEFGGKIRRA